MNYQKTCNIVIYSEMGQMTYSTYPPALVQTAPGWPTELSGRQQALGLNPNRVYTFTPVKAGVRLEHFQWAPLLHKKT